MLAAKKLKGKKRKFFELLFGNREFSSLTDAAEQAGYPKGRIASLLSGRWKKQFLALSPMLRKKFYCETKLNDGSAAPVALEDFLVAKTQGFDSAKLKEDARTLLKLLFPNSKRLQEAEPWNYPRKRSLPGLIGNFFFTKKRRPYRKHVVPPVDLQVSEGTPEQQEKYTRLFSHKGE